MSDNVQIWLRTAENSRAAGASLAATLYDLPLTILLQGSLGAGKTTLLQGLAHGLGVEQFLTSPTYALEQRYRTGRGELLHIDLYRLTEQQAQELAASTDDSAGIRCIEWSERIDGRSFERWIRINLREAGKKGGRMMNVTFGDIPLPTESEINAWQSAFCVLPHILAHCNAVASLAQSIADWLLKGGTVVRPRALRAAALVHDMLRFVDFRDGASHVTADIPPATKECWNGVRAHFVGMKHEAACAAFLRERGYDALASIVEVHGLTLPSPERTTIEQKILFYADKRIMLDRIVSLDERFADFRKRYGDAHTEQRKQWYEEAIRVEAELFPKGSPF